MPPSFDYDYDKQQQVDRWTRPELNYGCVEYLAPTDYMVRPPQPPVFLFIIDVSASAVKSGAVITSVEGIMAAIDKIPNETERTKIGFITVDQAVHFYTLVDNEPTMLTVSDFDDMYLPRPATDLLVNLKEARVIVDDLLERMKTMHDGNTSISNALGPALQAAYKLVVSIWMNRRYCYDQVINTSLAVSNWWKNRLHAVHATISWRRHVDGARRSQALWY